MKQMLWVHDTMEGFNQAVASQIARILRSACRLRGKALISLSGGSTPKGVYQALAQSKNGAAIPWDTVHFFWGDERCVPPEDPESNFKNAYDNLLKYIPVDPVKIHRIRGELNPQKAAMEYAKVLSALAENNHPWPVFDVAVMGMGEDGHTASLFPGAFNPGEYADPVIQVQAFYQDRPASRVSLTPMVFNSSRNVLFLVAGEAKSAVLQKVFSCQKDLLNIPAQRIQPAKGNLIWHLDSSAAKSIKDWIKPPVLVN